MTPYPVRTSKMSLVSTSTMSSFPSIREFLFTTVFLKQEWNYTTASDFLNGKGDAGILRALVGDENDEKPVDAAQPSTSNYTLSPQSGTPPALMLMMLQNILTILFTLLGNVLLVTMLLRSNKMQKRKRISPVQMLMLHMSLADILYALLCILPSLLMTATVPVFYGPPALCKFVKYIQVVPFYASAFLLVAISADRYQAICRPFASIRENVYNRPTLYALLAWSGALFFSSPQLFFFEKRNDDCVPAYSEWWQYVTYVCVFICTVWLIPSAVAGCFYFCVCRAVWRSSLFRAGLNLRTSMKQESRDADSLVPPVVTNGINSLQLQMQMHHKGARMQCRAELERRRLATVKLTLTIVAANFLLWAPFCITQVVDAFAPTAISPLVSTYIILFGNLNSCVNPWIWFIFNRDLLRRAMPYAQPPSM